MSNNHTPPAHTLAWIRDTIELLSWPPEQQLEYVKVLNVEIDELALQLNDALSFVDHLAEQQRLSLGAKHAIHDIDQRLAEMSKHDSQLWTEQALRSAPEWQEIRSLAHAALALFP